MSEVSQNTNSINGTLPFEDGHPAQLKVFRVKMRALQLGFYCFAENEDQARALGVQRWHPLPEFRPGADTEIRVEEIDSSSVKAFASFGW